MTPHPLRLSAESIASSLLSDRTHSPPLHPIPELDNVDTEEQVVTPALLQILFVSSLGGLLFGFDTGVVSGALLVIGTDLGGSPLSSFQESWLVSSALLAALVGSLVAGRLADWWGRKPVILLGAVGFALGALEQAAASVFKEVVLGRVLVGLAVGLASTVLPAYLAELSPPKFRGRAVAGLVCLITGGQVLSYVTDAIFASVPHGWRYMFGIGTIPAILQLLLAFALPESPRYLILHDRLAPARKTLQSLHPKSSPANIQLKMERIQIDLQEESILLTGGSPNPGFRDKKDQLIGKLWKQPGNRRALMLACGLQFFQQATGFNTVMYYSGKILQRANFANPVAFAILIAVSNFVCTVIALRLIDHLGRRPLLLYTLVGMSVSMFVVGLGFIFVPNASDMDENLKPGAGAYISLVAMITFCASYALGLGNIPWVVQSEVFTHELRALGAGFATATNWTANLIVAATFLQLAETITPTGAFWLYSLTAILAWIFTYFYLPETKGLDLEQTQALFERDRWNDPESGNSRISIRRDEYEAVASTGEAEEEEPLPQERD